tara:strand:+ start:43478 stop:44182 length:705 start_codon:yes stop_codon:yes gene_type:complete
MRVLKYITLILFYLLSLSFTQAQKISNVDFDLIKREISDSNSIFFYPNLLERFKKFDTTLTFLDYQHIYYGSVFQSNYSPYYNSQTEEKFYELYKKEKFKKAIPSGIKAFEDNPVNMRLIFRLAVANLAEGNKQKARKLANLYYNLMDVILSSGDGKSIQTAYVVTRVSDEYEIIAEYKLQVKKQQLIGNTDVMTFDKKAQKNRKEKIKVLYFNVFFPLNHLSNSFKQFDEETE